MQEKMFRHMEREIDDLDEGDRWKFDTGDEDENEEEGPGDADRA